MTAQDRRYVDAMQFSFQLTVFQLVPVTNYGVTYPVPDGHLGAQLDRPSVKEVAEKALMFYEKKYSELTDLIK